MERNDTRGDERDAEIDEIGGGSSTAEGTRAPALPAEIKIEIIRAGIDPDDPRGTLNYLNTIERLNKGYQKLLKGDPRIVLMRHRLGRIVRLQQALIAALFPPPGGVGSLPAQVAEDVDSLLRLAPNGFESITEDFKIKTRAHIVGNALSQPGLGLANAVADRLAHHVDHESRETAPSPNIMLTVYDNISNFEFSPLKGLRDAYVKLYRDLEHDEVLHKRIVYDEDDKSSGPGWYIGGMILTINEGLRGIKPDLELDEINGRIAGIWQDELPEFKGFMSGISQDFEKATKELSYSICKNYAPFDLDKQIDMAEVTLRRGVEHLTRRIGDPADYIALDDMQVAAELRALNHVMSSLGRSVVDNMLQHREPWRDSESLSTAIDRRSETTFWTELAESENQKMLTGHQFSAIDASDLAHGLAPGLMHCRNFDTRMIVKGVLALEDSKIAPSLEIMKNSLCSLEFRNKTQLAGRAKSILDSLSDNGGLEIKPEHVAAACLLTELKNHYAVADYAEKAIADCEHYTRATAPEALATLKNCCDEERKRIAGTDLQRRVKSMTVGDRRGLEERSRVHGR